jgi:uncharacterized protein DUF2283
MAKALSASYDPTGDVLYVLVGNADNVRNIEDQEGLVLRYDAKTNAPVGVTVIDYKEFWSMNRRNLTSKLSEFLHIERKETERAITKALRSAA